MNKKTLLEKAKQRKRPSIVDTTSKEMRELVLAWANDDITLTSVCDILKTSMGSQTYCRLALTLKGVIKDGTIIVKNIK